MSETALFDRYRQLWQDTHGYPCSLILSVLDFGKLGVHIKAGLSTQLLETALESYFLTDNPLVLKRKHPLGLFLANPMAYMPAKPIRMARAPVWVCNHSPRCAHRYACAVVTAREHR